MTNPANLVVIEGLVVDGAYEGLHRKRTAAEWLTLYVGNKRALSAIRRTRDGDQDVTFRDLTGNVWSLRVAA